jgi:hypothetical protein
MFSSAVGDDLEVLQLKEARNAEIVHGHEKDDRGR